MINAAESVVFVINIYSHRVGPITFLDTKLNLDLTACIIGMIHHKGYGIDRQGFVIIATQSTASPSESGL